MTPGVLDLLTVVRAKTLCKKGIPFVTKKLYGLIGNPVKTEHKAKWDAFWDYFVSTRTNNPLEA
ncbi:hypothetical protein PR003_g4116 [Phytophthora rubi]|uniref:Uncharacterized protein n=1 Tax=Phytophthora rubi TaxID=129364 RepID=A0A6A3P4G0_9STRA|nr:hypothetical protein PR001_g2732 [Phytophthora rubi]KAE9352966.1 hypothetical protein PR003_g4116 [Phytophthora rubi]